MPSSRLNTAPPASQPCLPTVEIAALFVVVGIILPGEVGDGTIGNRGSGSRISTHVTL